MNAAVDGLMSPTRTSRGKLQPEPHPLGDRVRDTVMSGIMRQFCDIVQQGAVTSFGEAEHSNTADRIRREQRAIHCSKARTG